MTWVGVARGNWRTTPFDSLGENQAKKSRVGGTPKGGVKAPRDPPHPQPQKNLVTFRRADCLSAKNATPAKPAEGGKKIQPRGGESDEIKGGQTLLFPFLAARGREVKKKNLPKALSSRAGK